MTRVAAIHKSEWRDGFLFVGNHVALDFLNTSPIQNGEPVELLPDFSALLRWFRAIELLSSREAGNLWHQWGESTPARHVVKAMRELRERLRKEVPVWERGGGLHRTTVDELNRLMAEFPMRTRLNANGSALSTELCFEPRRPEDLFAPIAHSAAMLFANVDRTRVRKCGQCVLHFYDTSKKGNRRWCSMQLCGNRFKVAAYAARQRNRERKQPSDAGV